MVDYTKYGHVYVELQNETGKYYACCNFLYVKSFDGILPTSQVHIYLLHPDSGSIVTMMEYDVDIDMYTVAAGYPELDSIDADTISEALKDYTKNIK